MFKKIKFDMSLLITSIFFGSLILFVLPIFDNSITSFSDRVIGNATLFRIDVSKRLKNIYFLDIILIPILTILINMFLSKLLKNTRKNVLKTINTISIFGIISVIMEFINVTANSNSIVFSSYILCGINLIIIAFSSLSNKEKVPFQDIKWCFMAAIPFAFFATLIMHRLNILIKTEIINWIFAYFFSVLIIILIISKLKKLNMGALKKSYILFLSAPLFEYIYLELYNILNQYNIFLNHKLISIAMIYIVLFILTIGSYLRCRNKKITFSYTRYYYPIIIIIFTTIIASVQMISKIDRDFYETANYGLGVYEFFRYGKLPIIETFDAHMLYDQIFGIIYGLISNDVNGAIFCIYNSYKIVFLYLISYFFFKKIFSKDIAFLITVLFPLTSDSGINTYLIGLLAGITLINVYEKKDRKSFTLFWLSLVFLCLFRLDIGFAVSFSSVIILIYIYIRNRKSIKLRDALIPLGVIVFSGLAIFVGVCIIKDINPVMRLIEFLKVSMSNNNWGYYLLGNNGSFAYPFAYYIMPVIVMSTLIYTIIAQKGKINRINIIVLFLGISYIFCIQRGLVRHSLYEHITVYILNFALLYLSMFIMNLKGKNVTKFLFAYSLLIIFSQLLITPNSNVYTNLVNRAVDKRSHFVLQYENYDQKVNRIQLSEKMINEYKNLKIIFDGILDDDETYLDMSNQTFLYALIDREKPVYVNQTPGLLSGELMQQLFIYEAQNYEKGIPVILKAKNKSLSETLDYVHNDYRYYLISEFMYSRYQPVAEINKYEIWVDKQVIDTKLDKLKRLNVEELKLYDKEEYMTENIPSMKLLNIPFVWGEYDERRNEGVGQELAKKIVLKNGIGAEIPINTSGIEKENGNYIKLRIKSDKTSVFKILLYSGKQELGEFQFVVNKGEYTYTVRTSTMYSWYEGNVDKIVVNADAEMMVSSISLLEGDTIKQL